MTIKDIVWIGQDEADLIITDGIFDLVIFAHPFNGNMGDIINDKKFYCYDSSNIHFSNEFGPSITKDGDNQIITAKIIDKKNDLVQLGNFIIELDDDIPNDLEDGSYVTFACRRIDLW